MSAKRKWNAVECIWCGEVRTGLCRRWAWKMAEKVCFGKLEMPLTQIQIALVHIFVWRPLDVFESTLLLTPTVLWLGRLIRIAACDTHEKYRYFASGARDSKWERYGN